MANWIDQVVDYDRRARRNGLAVHVHDDELQHLLDARAALADRLWWADEVITWHMICRLAERLWDGAGSSE